MIDEVFQRLEGTEAKRAAALVVYYRLKGGIPGGLERYRIEAGIVDERPDQSVIVN